MSFLNYIKNKYNLKELENTDHHIEVDSGDLWLLVDILEDQKKAINNLNKIYRNQKNEIHDLKLYAIQREKFIHQLFEEITGKNDEYWSMKDEIHRQKHKIKEYERYLKGISNTEDNMGNHLRARFILGKMKEEGQ